MEAAGFNFAQEAVGKELDAMARRFNRSMPRGGLITAKLTHKSSPKKPLPPVPAEVEGGMDVFHFTCCDEPVKHDGSSSRLFCIICGKQVGGQ